MLRTVERFSTAHGYPPMRVIPYLFCAAAGLCLTLYRPLSMQATSDGVQSILNAVLLIFSLVAILGVLTRLEVIELVGLCAASGPLVAYSLLLLLTAWDQPSPEQYAPLAVGFLIAALATFALLLVAALWEAVADSHREDERGDR